MVLSFYWADFELNFFIVHEFCGGAAGYGNLYAENEKSTSGICPR